MLYAKENRLGAIWVLAYTIEPDGIKIHGHSRNDTWAGQTLPNFQFMESEDHKRIALKVKIADNQFFMVINPKNVFSYGNVKDFTQKNK